MNEDLSFWDDHYRACGNVWAGNVSELPELPAGSVVLEAGCGNGKTLSAMEKKDWKIYGFDFSETASHLCRKNISANTYAEIFVSDASGLPFFDQTFDAIFARHITGHSKKDKREIIAGELKRVLKTGGLLFFSEFEMSDLRSKKGREIEEKTILKKNGIMTHFFSEEETIELFSGMTPLSVTTDRWSMIIKGKENKRAEINAVFKKNIQ